MAATFALKHNSIRTETNYSRNWEAGKRFFYVHYNFNETPDRDRADINLCLEIVFPDVTV